MSYELYGFIGSAPAFVLLGLISLSGLALGLRQGPAVSGLGLAASLVTPLLVTTTEPSYPVLYAYLAIVAAGGLVLATYRNWSWLSFAAAGGAFVWALGGLGLHGNGPFYAWLTYVAVIFTIVIALSVVNILKRESSADLMQHTIFPIASYASVCILLLGLLGVNDASARAMWPALAATALGFGLAWQWNRLAPMVPIGAVLSMRALVGRGEKLSGGLGNWSPVGFHIPTPLEGTWGGHVLIAFVFALAVIIVTCLAARRSLPAQGFTAILWAAAGTVFPLIIVFGLWGLGAHGEIQRPFALIFALFALAFAAAAEWLIRALPPASQKDDAVSPLIHSWPVNLFAVFAPISALLMLAASLPGMLMTFGLVAVLAATAFAHTVRPVWLLRLACVGIGAVLTLQTLNAIANGGEESARFLFNELWAYLALPAAVSAGASWLLSQKHEDKWSQVMEALALAFTALFAVFQVRHFMNDGDIFAGTMSLEELSLQILVGLCFSLGLSRIKSVSKFSVFSIAAMGAMGISLLNLLFGSLLALNPLFNPDETVNGGFLFNTLLLAYLVPGLALGAIAWLQQERRPTWYLKTLGGVGLLLLVVYLTTMARLGYQGGEQMALGNYDIANAEQYTYSIVWLLFGIALLAAGLVFKSRELRIGSAAVMMLTVAKVFLVDMSELEGILRALSFVGLGGVLIGMGLVYQRVLSRDEREPEMAETQDAS